MKYYFQRTWGALLTLGLLLSTQSSFAQNVPTHTSNFAEENLQYTPNGTIIFNGVTIDKKLKPYLQENSTEEQVFVFTFSDPEIAKQARPQLEALGGEPVGPEFEHMPIQGIYATAEEVIAMTQVEGVFGIWENSKQDQELHDAVIVSSVKDTWEDSEFTTLNNGLALSGQGVGVLINDSGFDGDDTDLQTSPEGENYPTRLVQNVRGTALGFESVEMGDNVAGDDTDQGGGHGSHCAGIVGGDGRHSNNRVVGVAPRAQLIGYGSGAGLSILDVAGGYEYIVNHKEDYNIRVMSNSYGSTSDNAFTTYQEATTNPTSIITKTLSDAGVIVVFSAGNSGAEDGTITGSFKTAPWVICVGNGVKDGTLAGSSSRGRQDPGGEHPSMRQAGNTGGKNYLWENRPTVTAPGTDIVAVRATGSALSGLSALDDAGLSPSELPYYTTLSGTSMACPHVAGIIALMLEANPQLEWRAVKAILQRTAIDAMAEAFHQRGAGYVNAWAATAAAFNGLCDVSEDASYEEKYGLPIDGSFGFDEDPWKTCELHPEVFERMKASIPTPTGVESLCSPTEPVSTDSEGDGGAATSDIVEVQMHDETADDFKITLKVAGNLIAAIGTPGVGIRYNVLFTHNHDDGETPSVEYVVTSGDEGLGPDFILSARRADSEFRASSQMQQAITGEWDTVENTITWTIPKAEMNVANNPENNTDPVDRNGKTPQTGNRLSKFKGYSYQAGLLSLNTPLDSSTGNCFRVFEQ